MNVFESLGLPASPLVLAPLAGVSDHPFRRVCAAQGADLTYVEMISATALLYDSPRTLIMMTRHPDERLLGIQITGKSAEETAKAVAKLHLMNFDTIDINMGCPVKKVTKTGCGSAILKDPERIYRTVKLCKEATDKPLSVKIRIGWDLNSINTSETARAAYEGGADWITIHGRSRACDYSTAVNLDEIAKVASTLPIPILGNGNIFGNEDAKTMTTHTAVGGLMISRGALGNPWIFRSLRDPGFQVSLDNWYDVVCQHLEFQLEAYQNSPGSAVCMRKHLLWYTKGWIQGKQIREQINLTQDLREAKNLITSFYRGLKGIQDYRTQTNLEPSTRFAWDPKFEMDRQLDRGVGHLGLEPDDLLI